MPGTLKKVTIGITVGALLATTAAAASFGSTIVVNDLEVNSIFRGSDGPIYVTFSPANLAGCNSSAGGYLTSMWSEAGTPDPAAAKDQLALLMLAKSTDAPVEVRYRVNVTGTGWDKCAIDAIWVKS